MLGKPQASTAVQHSRAGLARVHHPTSSANTQLQYTCWPPSHPALQLTISNEVSSVQNAADCCCSSKAHSLSVVDLQAVAAGPAILLLREQPLGLSERGRDGVAGKLRVLFRRHPRLQLVVRQHRVDPAQLIHLRFPRHGGVGALLGRALVCAAGSKRSI